MADSLTFKGKREDLDKLDGLRYRWDTSGYAGVADKVHIRDEDRDLWTRVEEGDKIVRSKDGKGWTVDTKRSDRAEGVVTSGSTK